MLAANGVFLASPTQARYVKVCHKASARLAGLQAGGSCTCRLPQAEDAATADLDAAVVLLEEGFGLKVGNFVQQRRLQRATCDLLNMHDSHTATLSKLDEVCCMPCLCPSQLSGTTSDIESKVMEINPLWLHKGSNIFGRFNILCVQRPLSMMLGDAGGVGTVGLV